MYSHSHGSSPLPLSPLSADLTVKRLDFENIRIATATATATSPRTQVLNIRRDLERCRDDVSDTSEIIEPLKLTAAEYADIDPSKLWNEYMQLKKEVLRVQTENLFLESYLEPESAVDDVTESDLQVLESQLADVRSTTLKERQEIGSLIGTFAAAMENFPQLLESVLNHFDECDRKFQLLERSKQPGDEMEEAIALNKEGDGLESKACELRRLAGEMEIQILELDEENLKQEEYYEHLQSLHEMHTKLELLNKVMTFFSDWSVDSCEEDVVTFTFRGSSNKQQKVKQNKHQQKLAKELVYKLHVKIDMKSLAVENVQRFEPKHEVPPIDDILKEMSFRRTMHSMEASHEAHNDLEFLLRRVGQRISSLKSSSI